LKIHKQTLILELNNERSSGVSTHLSTTTTTLLKVIERHSGSTTTTKIPQQMMKKAFQSRPAAKQEIKDLGKKARARLEGMKSKRPEIKRLDAAPPTEETQTKRIVSTTAFRRRPASLVQVHRPKKRTLPRGAPPPPTRRRSAPHHQRRKVVEEWTPDTSQISALPKELCSTIVKLHGLSFGCTLEQIKTFFYRVTTGTHLYGAEKSSVYTGVESLQ
jgi:hypothetical protein